MNLFDMYTRGCVGTNGSRLPALSSPQQSKRSSLVTPSKSPPNSRLPSGALAPLSPQTLTRQSHSTPNLHAARGSSLSPPAAVRSLPPRLHALAQFKCLSPTCLRLGQIQPRAECEHQYAARAQREDGAAPVDALSSGLALLEMMERQSQQKRKQRATTAKPKPIIAPLLPDVHEALLRLLTPPRVDMAVLDNVISAYSFEHEIATVELMHEHQVRLWQHRSAKVFSVCELPFLHPPDAPSPVPEKRTAEELAKQQRLARSRDASLIALAFSFLPPCEVHLTMARVNHLWRVCTWHHAAWADRVFAVGDLSTPLEENIPGKAFDAHHRAPRSLTTRMRALTKPVRHKIGSLEAVTTRAQAASAMAEFKLDHLLLTPNLKSIRLELGVINGGHTLRQESSKRLVEDVITAKQLRSVQHLILESNPIATSSGSSLVAPSMRSLVTSESRAAQWLRQMIPYWETCRDTYPSPSPSIPSRPSRSGLLTLDLQRVLFEGCWIMRVLEKAQCTNLETLALSISFAVASTTEKGVPKTRAGANGASRTATEANPSSNSTNSLTHTAATLSRQRLIDLFLDAKVIPSLFRTFAGSMKHLTLALENDRVLAREKVTECTAVLVFLPLLKSLEHLELRNLKLAHEGAAVVPLAAAPSTSRTTAPVHSTLFHLPSWKHLQRVRRLDRVSGELQDAWAGEAALRGEWQLGDGVSDDEFDSDGELVEPILTPTEIAAKELGDAASRAAVLALTKANKASKLEARLKRRELERAAGIKNTRFVLDDALDDFPPISPPPKPQPAFSMLCINDFNVCRCSSCASKLHASNSTFGFMMSSLSQLRGLRELVVDDLAITDFAQIITQTTTTQLMNQLLNNPATTTTPLTVQTPSTTTTLVSTSPTPTGWRYRRQVSNEFTVLTTTSTVSFASCAPFLLLAALNTLVLPISCFEFDVNASLVDSVCVMLGARLRHLTVVVYGNGWTPRPTSTTEDDNTPPSFGDADTDGNQAPLPYPRLRHLSRLSSLESFTVRRDTAGLTSRDPALPVLPLIASLSVATNPELTHLVIDGFAADQEDLWTFLAERLGTVGVKPEPPPPIPRPRALLRRTSTNASSSVPSSLPGSPTAASRRSTRRGSVTAADGSLIATRSLLATIPAAAAIPTATAPYFPGLRSLTLHNYTGTLTSRHLGHLRLLANLNHLSLGNRLVSSNLTMPTTSSNDLDASVAKAEMESTKTPASRATTAAPNTRTNANTASGSAVSPAPPLSASVLASLPVWLPALHHLELLGQERLTNAVFRFWMESKPSAIVVQPSSTATTDISSADSSASPTPIIFSPATSPPTSPPSVTPSYEAHFSAAVPVVPPFPLLSSLSLLSCRPLGYTGLAQLARSQLCRFEWVGLEHERRLIQQVQQAMAGGAGGPRSASLQFKKG